VIVNADASQVYRDLRILSARPSEEEEESAEHRLFGYIDGAQPASAASWAADARREIAAVHEEGRLPILVGGTGLYIRTLLDGIAPVPDIPDAIRDHVRALPLDEAWQMLLAEDSEAATTLRPSDDTRVRRALEVMHATGRPITHWHRQTSGGIGAQVHLRPLVLTPPRDWLYPRCDLRLAQMVEEGALAEVEALARRRLLPELPVMRAIGVPDFIAFLNGERTLDEAIAGASQATRRYAKRQLTWFRNQPPPDWPRARDIEDAQAWLDGF